MDALKVILTVVYILVCVAIMVLVLMQDSKNQGLSGALAGGSGNSYWSKNKGRSKEGILNKVTIVLGIVFVVLSVVMSLNGIQ